ncbi:MAG TPA: hypothetical protein VLG13_02915, partial [Patescibacteria group bacterium]|nr:hypothetical protein [Patescibacteria group bacterium]
AIAQTWHGLWQSLFNAPYFLVLRAVQYAGHSIFYSRLVAVAFGFLAVVLLYYVVYKWLGWKMASIAALLFGTNSYLLHASRLADPAVLQIVVGISLVALFCVIYKQPSARGAVLWLMALPLLLYVPGAIWPVVVTMLMGWRKLLAAWSVTSKKVRIFGVGASLLLVAPLLYFLVHTTLLSKNFAVVRNWLGWNLHGDIVSLSKSYLRGLGELPRHLFWHGNGLGQPALSVGNLPAVGVATAILALLGLYVVISRYRDARWRLVIILLLTGWLASGLGVLGVAVVLPYLYILAAIGLAYLLTEWYKVFPRNPIARGLGFGLIIAVVALSGLYDLRSYFVAWPHMPATTQTFDCPPAAPRPAHCLQSNF